MFNRGILFQKREEKQSLVSITKPRSYVAEEFRTLRTNIQYSMVNKHLKTLMLTSAVQGEGKSTLSSNLAAVFASQGEKVLLVDADMRRPSLHQTFDLFNSKGLSTLLTDHSVPTRNVVRPTHQRNLFVLTSGAIPSNPSELLASERMEEVMQSLKNEFDLIIFDMPPVVAFTDAQIMATKTDGTVFVIRNGGADKKEIKKAKRLLDQVDANVLGAIFNGKEQTRNHSSEYYYGTESKRGVVKSRA